MPGMSEKYENGYLTVQTIDAETEVPVIGAEVSLHNENEIDAGEIFAETDLSGFVGQITLKAPAREYSEEIQDEYMPYGSYEVIVRAQGYETVRIQGVEILAGETALLTIRLNSDSIDTEQVEEIHIPEHILWRQDAPKTPESEIKPMDERGEIVLSRVVVPETIVVHDGAPSNASAKNYYVPYRDYIKNVACSEIYATWPRETLIANILAIQSITLNRVYTEWYRNKGYDFTITSSTAYDQKWVYGRNIFEEIDILVDELFTQYLSLPNIKQPIFTQYCDGKRVSCPNWLSQWGSKYLGDQGYTASQILKYYYGSEIYINSAEIISGIPASYPGYALSIGDRGQKVRQLQEQLSAIAKVYSAIPMLTADGIYGELTAGSVREFQRIFGLPVNGIVDYRTWYKISQLYVGVTRIGEFMR